MGDPIMDAAMAWAEAREDGTHVDAMRALDTLQRTIADEIAAAVAAERARCAKVAAEVMDGALKWEVSLGNVYRVGWTDAAQKVLHHITTPAPTPEPATPTDEAGEPFEGAQPGTAEHVLNLAAAWADTAAETEESVRAVVALMDALHAYGDARVRGGVASATHDDIHRVERMKWMVPLWDHINELVEGRIRRGPRRMQLVVEIERVVDEAIARARTASAVPEVVRDGARSYARILRADASDDPRLTSHQRRQNETHAAQIDAWLRATAGAEVTRG